MHFFRIRRLYLHSILALWLWVCGGMAYGQNLNPAAQDFQLEVVGFTLAAPTEPLAGDLSVERLNQRLALERARFGEEMSIDELHQVADSMTLYVRNLGYVFHTVYLPPQRVDGGLVEYRLQEGRLVGVNVINNTSMPNKRFTRIFDELVGRVLVGSEVEERVQALKAQGGFNVFPFYSRGAKAGEARLNLKVDRARKRSFLVKADNYGSPASGEYRLIGQYSEYQLTGHHDRLSLALLQAVDGVANTYGSIQYDLPFSNLEYNWDISVSNNQFEVGDRYAALGLEGVASTVKTGFTRQLKHHPKHASRLRFGVYEKRNDLDLANLHEMSRVASMLLAKSKLWSDSGTVVNVAGEFSIGEYEVESVDPGTFTKLDVSGMLLKGFGEGRWRNLAQASVRGQLSQAPLPGIEGFTLTGAYGVRGFASGGLTADNALLVSAEWRFPNLISSAKESSTWRLEPYLVGDFATGTKKNFENAAGLSVTDTASYGSLGVGLRMAWGRHLSGQFVASAGLDGDFNGIKVDSDEQLFFELRWH
jgi:hemolysin activation/secretion protein